MSYIVARKVDQGEPSGIDYGMALAEINFEERERNALEADMDFEMLRFILGLIEQVDALAEGEALVVWKEIF